MGKGSGGGVSLLLGDVEKLALEMCGSDVSGCAYYF